MIRLISTTAILAATGFAVGCDDGAKPRPSYPDPCTCSGPPSNGCMIMAGCDNDLCVLAPKTAGTPCDFDGGKYCSAGSCVECVTSAHCTGGWVCDKTQNKCVKLTDCGNDMIDLDETCDGLDLGGKTCADVATDAPEGTLACRTDCEAFNTGGCSRSDCPLALDLGVLEQIDSTMDIDSYETEGVVSISIGIDSSTTIFFELYEGGNLFGDGFTAGTYQLTGDETSYNTCSLCVLLKWQNPANEEDFILYMPMSGTVQATTMTVNRFAGTMLNMPFAELGLVPGRPFADPGCKTKIQLLAFSAEVDE